jgi:hypothetical protein
MRGAALRSRVPRSSEFGSVTGSVIGRAADSFIGAANGTRGKGEISSSVFGCRVAKNPVEGGHNLPTEMRAQQALPSLIADS